MLRRIVTSRRRRLILYSIVAGGVTVVLAIVWVSHALRAERYLPGEHIEGITRTLDRPLPPGAPQVRFTEVASQAGVVFQQFGGSRSTQLPEDMMSGAAWGDYDGDGLDDLYACAVSAPLTANPAEAASSSVHNRLFRNRGDGSFEDVTAEAGVGLQACSAGASWADIDGDGDLDLLVTAFGSLTLYRNNGNRTFSDVSRAAGLGQFQGFWTGASWADYDRDGDLDVYVCGYVQYHYDPKEMDHVTLQYNAQVPFTLNPSSYKPERNLLLRNNGKGAFSEVAVAAGVDNPSGRSLSAAWCDFDMDGWPDLYVANDISDNALYRNLGNGRFEDLSHAAWVADYRGAMGLGIGDWNNDGDLDIFITHWLAQENALYDNQWVASTARSGRAKKQLRFMDIADQAGLGQIALDFIGWGTSFFDYDNDGRPDLLAVNGSTFQDDKNPKRLIGMTSQLFWNRGPEGFYELGRLSGDYFSRSLVGRGAAFADYDNDGDLDVFVVNHGDPPALLRNDGGNRGHWIRVRVRSKSGNTHGILSVVRVQVGGQIQIQSLGSQPSYLSHNQMDVHFGLGASTTVDRIEVRFPNGRLKTLRDVPVDRILTVEDGPP